MIVSTSASGLLKFSIEKAKTVSFLIPNSKHHLQAWNNEHNNYNNTFESFSAP